MQAKQPRSASTVASISPPSATRTQRSPGTVAYQIAPSASAQMPSGALPSPSSAHTRRSSSDPDGVIVQAVRRSAGDSATTTVSSSRIAIPLGNHTSSATWRLLPSGSTTATIPGLRSSHGIEPGMSTQARPARSTTISLSGWPLAPYGVRSTPATSPRLVVMTSRPSGSQSMENGSPSTRASTRREPSAEKDSTSPASQSHIQNRPSCHRGDSPIWMPAAKISLMTVQTPSDRRSHRVRPARAADLKQLAPIEEAGGALFEEAFGDLTGDPLMAPAPRGGDRDDTPGFLLVVGPVGGPVGFVHVELVDGFAHLAQLSVHPDAMRQGVGSALVRAAKREARELGFDRLSLTTYRDLPWNGPFYARLGFGEAPPPEPFELRVRREERRLGLDRHGPRSVMEVALTREVTGQ